MLVIEVWNGNCWRVAGRIKPGESHAMIDYRARDDTELLRVAVEPERTTITIGNTTIELRAASEPWERMLHARWMRAAMFCRLHHRPEPIRSVAYGRNGEPRWRA